MRKKLTASAATSFLLLGASGGAVAQEVPPFPPLTVLSLQTTPDDVADRPIAVGDLCVDAIRALRAVELELQGTNVIQTSLLAFVMGGRRSGANAILICAPEGMAPIPSAPPPPPPQ
jgi:hypothetical protein